MNHYDIIIYCRINKPILDLYFAVGFTHFLCKKCMVAQHPQEDFLSQSLESLSTARAGIPTRRNSG